MANGTRGVTFQLKLDNAGLKSGAKDAEAAFENLANKVNAATEKLSNALDKTNNKLSETEKQTDKAAAAGERWGIALGAAITTVSAAYLGLTAKAIKGLDDTYNAAQRLGTSTEFISSIGVAAQQNNVDFGRLNTTLNQFADNVTKAAGGSRVQTQLFAAMGISVRDAQGHVKSLDDLLPQVAAKFATYKDGLDKDALANKLFGESGSDLLALLNDLGNRGFAKVREEAEKLGLVVDEKTAASAHAFNDELTALKQTTEAYFNRVAADVLPSLIDLAQRFNGAASDAADLDDKSTIVGTTLRELIHDIDDLTRVLGRLPDDARAVKTEFGGWADEIQRVIDLLPKVKQGGGSQGLFDFPTGEGGLLPGVQATRNFFSALTTPTLGSDLADKSLQEATKPLSDFDNLLKITVPDIDKASASLDGLANHVDATTKATRQLNAPFADLSRNRKGDNGLALENQLESFERYADSLSEKVGGPLQQAFQKYSDTLDAIDARAEKLVIDGANVNRVIAAQNVAYGNANAVLRQNITLIQLKKEKEAEAGYEKLQKSLADYLDSQGQELDLLEAQIEAGGELTDVQKTELDLRRLLSGASESDKTRLKEETDEILKNARAREQLNNVLKLQQTVVGAVNDLIEGTRQGVINGDDAFKALGDTAARVLPGIANNFADILKKLADAHDGTVDFSSAIEGLGTELEKTLPALGQLLGTVAGGGGNGAQIGSAVGSIAGGIIGSIIPYVGTYIGAAIGGLLGGVIGGQGDGGGTPRIYASSIPGSVGRDGTQAVNTPLGIIAADTDNLADDAYKQFEATVKGFDIQLAKLFDPDQLDKVQKALEGFSGKFSDINALLTARFDVILGTFDQSIQDFVNGFAGDLQGRVQTLADVLSLQKLDKAGGLITDNLADALALVNEFSAAGERVLDTYARLAQSTADYQQVLALTGATFEGSKTELVEFAQGITDAVGGTQQASALWQAFFADFYDQAQRTAANINTLQAKANDSLTAIGLDATTSMADFKAKFTAALPTLTPEEVAQWLQAGVALGSLNDAINALIEQGENLVDKLYGGGTLSDVNSQIAALEGQADHASSSVQHFGSAMTSAADAAKHAADLLLGALSPLNDEQKLQYALTGLRRGTVTQEQVLEIGRQLYASSQAYTDLFNMVRAIGDRTGTLNSGGNFNAATSQQSNTLSAADQQRLDELYARRDELQARERRQDANQLATVVAQLGFTQKKSFDDVADFLGFHLSDLAKDLGLTNDQLNDFLTNIQTQQNAIPDAVTAGSDNVVRALYDIAGKDLPPWAVGSHDEVTGSPNSIRGHSGHARGTIVVPGQIIGSDTTTVTASSTTAMVEAQNETNRRLDLLLSETRNGTAATRDAALATRNLPSALRNTTLPGRRNARVAA